MRVWGDDVVRMCCGFVVVDGGFIHTGIGVGVYTLAMLCCYLTCVDV